MTQPSERTDRSRRIEDAILGVSGVSSVKVWETPEGIEVGIGLVPGRSHEEVLRRVREASSWFQSPGEPWGVGLLSER